MWNPFTIDTDGSGAKTVAPTMFLTYGVKHLKIWTLAKDDVSGGDRGEEGEWRALKALLQWGGGMETVRLLERGAEGVEAGLNERRDCKVWRL